MVLIVTANEFAVAALGLCCKHQGIKTSLGMNTSLGCCLQVLVFEQSTQDGMGTFKDLLPVTLSPPKTLSWLRLSS
jgi:hypothetical protein